MSVEVQPEDGRFPDEEPEVFPRVFGNYLLLHRLARGGMGEVYLAKTGGLAGIEKHSVVKTLRPHFTSDREYVTRFIDEARVVVGLTHRNIAQTFDVGRVGHQYYLAMEYIPGMDVRSIQDRFQEQSGGANLDEALSLHMVCEVLEALDYAHRAKSPQTGKPLHLVHRDISPQNVMVNFEGEVKLIDFGLAQSTTKEEHTQPHMVMGKMAYMSPEQARGEGIDATADQFAVAVVLYELLVGERYYGHMNPEQIWAVAGRGDWLPPRLGELPSDLVRLLRRALDPDPRRRYSSCGDFREELVGYQYAQGMRAGAREIRALMQKLYATEQQQHETLVAHYANVRLADFLADDPWVTPSGKMHVPPNLMRDDSVSFLPSQGHAESFGAPQLTHSGAHADERRGSQPTTLQSQSSKGGEPTGETRRLPRAPGEEVSRRLLPFAAAAVLVVMLVLGVVIGLTQGADTPGASDDLIITEVLATAPLVVEAGVRAGSAGAAFVPDAVPDGAAADDALAHEALADGEAADGEAPHDEEPAAPEGEPRADATEQAAPAREVSDEPTAAAGDPTPPVERRAPRRRPSKRKLPDSVRAQSPQLPIQKITFLKRHCLDRVSCASRLTDLDKIDPTELDKLNKSGKFDACIRRCKD